MKGKRIESVEEVQALAWARRAVCSEHIRRLPAAVIIFMQCAQVLKYINDGLYVYEKEHKHTRLCNSTVCGEESVGSGIIWTEQPEKMMKWDRILLKGKKKNAGT